MSFSRPIQRYHSHADPIWPPVSLNLDLSSCRTESLYLMRMPAIYIAAEHMTGANSSAWPGVELSAGDHKEMSVYLGWPIAPSYRSPNAGGGLRGLSQWEMCTIAHGAQINFGDLTPYLAYGWVFPWFKYWYVRFHCKITPQTTANKEWAYFYVSNSLSMESLVIVSK